MTEATGNNQRKSGKPRCRRAMKLRDKTKPGRGRVDAAALVETLCDVDEWSNFRENLE